MVVPPAGAGKYEYESTAHQESGDHCPEPRYVEAQAQLLIHSGLQPTHLWQRRRLRGRGDQGCHGNLHFNPKLKSKIEI